MAFLLLGKSVHMILAERQVIASRLKRDEVQLYSALLDFHTNSISSLGTVAALVASFGFGILANNLPNSANIVYFSAFQVTAACAPCSLPQAKVVCFSAF